MTLVQNSDRNRELSLRLWPGVVAVVLQWLLWVVVPLVSPAVTIFAVFGSLACGLAVVLWWLFFSRAPWSERVGAIVLMVIAIAATKRVVHRSIAEGTMGMLLFAYAIPALSLVLVAGAFLGRRLSSTPRRTLMVAGILVACGVFTLLRTDGIIGDARSEFRWRWAKTPEERLMAQGSDEPLRLPSAPESAPVEMQPPTRTKDQPTTSMAAPAATRATEKSLVPAVAESSAVWPGFRGSNRDGVIRGVRIEKDWSRSKPVELWRRPIGPGWSSFAVSGNLLYTQEQRAADEVVSCYNLTTGAPVWRHRDPARFWESNAGAGPRATPTVSNGRVYTLGATGIVNALDAGNGAVVWSRNAASDTGAKPPGWGFAGSPLVVNNAVIVAASGRLAAYDVSTGTPRWSAQTGGSGYSSPQLATIDGIVQILLLNTSGAASVAPADGTLLWKHAWRSDGIVQPALIAGSDILIGSGSGPGVEVGTRRIGVARGSSGWTVEERWTSTGLKPYYNDFVVHEGHAFGFDGSILACIDLSDGKRMWKGGRYGHGQLLLLADQDMLLVLSEEGELALVAAVPGQFTEVARFPAMEGKTWNHPVLAGSILLVRNGQEMAAFRLSLAGG